MGVAEVAEQDSPISDQDAASIEGGIRALVRRNRLAVAAELIDHPCDNALMAGAASIADIDKLMAELQTARDFLQSEAERVRRMNARYAHLAQTASASVKVIAESLGRWRDTESGSLPHAAMPRAEAPSLSPPQDPDSENRVERSVARSAAAPMWCKPLNCFADASDQRCPFQLISSSPLGLTRGPCRRPANRTLPMELRATVRMDCRIKSGNDDVENDAVFEPRHCEERSNTVRVQALQNDVLLALGRLLQGAFDGRAMRLQLGRGSLRGLQQAWASRRRWRLSRRRLSAEAKPRARGAGASHSSADAGDTLRGGRLSRRYSRERSIPRRALGGHVPGSASPNPGRERRRRP